MEYGFSVFMFSVAVLLLLYALVLSRSKDPKMIPRDYAAKMAHPREYARQFAKVIALVAMAPLLSGVVGLFAGNWIPGAVLLLGLIVTICLGVRIMKKAE